MKTFVAYVIAALLLLGSAEAVRRGADVQDHLSSGEEELATMAPEAAEAEFSVVEASMGVAGRVPIVGPAMLEDVREQQAFAKYWRADYGALPSDETELASEDMDPDLIFLAANGAFRTAQSRPTVQEALKDIDKVIRMYTLLLRKSPGHVDGAYNYEYVVRLRNILARLRQDTPMTIANNSIHGKQGAPPMNVKADDFNVVVPLRPEERGDQMMAGTGAGKQRKG